MVEGGDGVRPRRVGRKTKRSIGERKRERVEGTGRSKEAKNGPPRKAYPTRKHDARYAGAEGDAVEGGRVLWAGSVPCDDLWLSAARGVRKGERCDWMVEESRSEIAGRDFRVLAYCVMPDHSRFLAEGMSESGDLPGSERGKEQGRREVPPLRAARCAALRSG